MKQQIFRLLIFVLTTISVCSHAQTIQQANSLHQRGRELINDGKITEGRECTRQAMEMRRQLLGELSEDYITSLNNYAYSFGAEQNWQKAAELQEQVMALCGKLETPHKDIGMYTTNMGRYYYLCGNKAKAAQMWEQALPLVEKHGEIYEYLLNGLSSVYYDLSDIKGIEHIMALMEEHNRHELTKPCDAPQCMLERAQYYASTGNQAKAKEHYQKAIDMKPEGKMAVTVYESYANYMAMTERDRLTGAEYQSMAAKLRKELNGEDVNFAKSIFNAGLYYSFDMTDIGFQKAITCFDQARQTFERLNDAQMVAKCQHMEGNAYGGLKNFAKARDCYLNALAYYKANDKESDEYPKMIERVAAMEKFNKEYDASILHYRQALDIFAERGMMQEYGDAENGLKLCYAYAGKNMDEASDGRNDAAVKAARAKKINELIAEAKSNLELTRTYLGKLEYARSLAIIAGEYGMLEDYKNSISYYQQYMQSVRDAVREEFRLESEQERMRTWSDEAATITELKELLVLMPDSLAQYRSDVASMVYDAELLRKGILLNSSIEFEKLLIGKNDKRLTDIYRKSKANKSEIERLRREANSYEDMEKIIELTQESQRLQSQLNNGLDEMDDFTNYISYDWKDVRDNLKEGDVSIEFATVTLVSRDTPSHMVALMLTKDMQKPEAVVLWDDEYLYRSLIQQDSLMFTKPDVGEIVWGRLAPYLQGKNRIFFSADGVFNNIGIEYLPFKGKPLSEQFEVYRLSSTKELCYKHENKKPTRAALFGDINYNEGASMTKDTKRAVMALRNSVGLEKLSYTSHEIDGIEAQMKKKGMRHVAKFRGTQASKETFMNLSGSSVNNLVIATHGIYSDSTKTTEAESMNNCKLAFANAAMNDSCFVTAAEIAKMDLRQCDLAVLSACETGLGKLGDDGVFGLQRGFKNAGVHTLLMSLKKVYDASTAELMICFYKHLMNDASATKREALVKAQKDIRDKGYKDPKYWATFILLDAI